MRRKFVEISSVTPLGEALVCWDCGKPVCVWTGRRFGYFAGTQLSRKLRS